MQRVNFEDGKCYIIEQLNKGKAVCFFVRSLDKFDFLGQAIQISSYFAHAEWLHEIVAENGNVKIRTLNARIDGVQWDWFENYKKDVETGKKELVIGVINTTPEQAHMMRQEARAQKGHPYDIKQCIWHGVTGIISFLTPLGKMLAYKLDTFNPFSVKNDFNCSESCTRIIRSVKNSKGKSVFDVCAGQNADAVTPGELGNDRLLIKDVMLSKV